MCGYGNSQKQPWRHRQELPYDGQCVGKALVEIGRLQKQRLIRTRSEGPASLEERECVCWGRVGEVGQGSGSALGQAQLGLGCCHGGFEMSLLSGVSVSGRNGHPHTPT